MTPQEREKFDLEIYLETKNPLHNGCLSDASDYLRRKDASKLSRQLNPHDERKDTLVGEVMDVLEAFNHKHPTLERFIWEKMVLRRNVYKKDEVEERQKLAEIVDRTSREQLDVSFVLNNGASEEDIKREAYQAYEHSKNQYEKIAGVKITEIVQ